MGSHVFSELVSKTKSSLAHRTREGLLVRLDVFVQNGFACERLATFRAFERLFNGVYTSLVKRAAPIIAEYFTAFGARKMTLFLAFPSSLSVGDVHVVHMLSQALSVAVALATRRASVGLLVGVHRHVFLHVAWIRTGLATHRALVDVIPSMNPFVFLQVRRTGKALVAFRAQERLLAAVCEEMDFQTRKRHVALATYCTVVTCAVARLSPWFPTDRRRFLAITRTL